MPYTFLQLKTEVRQEAFPDGEAKNLVVPHNRLFAEAMIEIQQGVQRYQHNNTQIVTPCSTFFQCGMTVFEAPRGIINRLSTFVHLDENCVEDINAPISWCSEIKYARIEYHLLKKILDRQLGCRCSGMSLDSFMSMNIYSCRKWLGQAFPPPTDADYIGFPELPLGFHYPQDSTDVRRRAIAGVWALYHNRIYLAPWINSTEVIVVEWDGLKRDWSDADLVDTEKDPLLTRAVKHYLLMNHFGSYERDPAMEAYHREQYLGNPEKNIIGALPALYHQFREETRERNERETDSHSMMSGETLVGQAGGPIP